jgi:hypothetical protein
MSDFKLQFPPEEITFWAEQYNYRMSDSVPDENGRAARAAGYLTRDQFLAISTWKSQRPRKRHERNSESFVREVTQSALSSADPRFKIEVLRLLDGVDWATASVILHFCDELAWPVLDFRAFWSLGRDLKHDGCSFDIWRSYTEFTRAVAEEQSVTMRTLDRALWEYSRQKQKSERRRTS